jgi:DNA-binding transcriptional LysR family regulator
MRHLIEGLLDVGVMYSPQSRPGLHMEKLLEERLVLVSTRRRTVDEWDEDYVAVDCGPEFRVALGQAFPNLKVPAVSVSLEALGLQHILGYGGSGYFPMRLVRGALAAGRLFQVTGAPEFRRPAYLVYPEDETRDDWFAIALDGLRYVASLESEE